MAKILATPKYLKEIESKLQQKLTLLIKPQSDLLETQQIYYDSVLEIYQEAFINLIQCTTIYSTFLNGVKNVYDQAIKIRDERIAQSIIEDKLFGVSVKKKQRDDKMKGLLKEIEELKEQNLKLTLDISKLKKEMGKMKDEEFSEYVSLMRERDARYTLYFENVALQLRLKELDGAAPASGAHPDPAVLRIALDRCREQLSSAMSEVRKLEEQCSGTVPRREHDLLEARLARTSSALAAASAELRALRDTHHAVLAAKQCVEEELAESKERCGELERAGTPRPHWQLCADFISGGRDRWRQLSAGLSSQETLRVLLRELAPHAHSDHLDYFQGLGTAESVPACLRWSGRVRDVRLSRRDVCVLLADLWRRKEHRPDMHMQQYLHQYFQERYEEAAVRAEWAYNLFASAEHMLDEPAVGVWWSALAGPHAERRYWALRGQWRALREHVSTGKQSITVQELERACRAVFPLKSEAEVRAVCEAARRQLKLRGSDADLNLHKLFHEGEEGFLRLEVAAELARQRAAAHARYVRELLGALAARRAPVSVPALQRALAIIDPAIDHIRMEQYVRAAFGEASAALADIPPAPLRALAARLAAADIERVGPRTRARHHRNNKTL